MLMKKVFALSVCLLVTNMTFANDGVEQNSRALLMSVAAAVETSHDCQSLAAALNEAIIEHKEQVQNLLASHNKTSGQLSENEEKRIVAAVEKVKFCKGIQGVSEATKILLPVGAKYQCKASKSSTLNLESTSDCENDCCIEGWQTWATVAWYSAACLAGDEQACCLAPTLASYDACVNTYCPTNDCCANINPNGWPAVVIE